MREKRNFLRLTVAFCLTALFFCCTRVVQAQTGKWVAAEGTMKPVVASAELISAAGTEGDSTVTVVGTDMIQVHLGTMTVPGAYAEIRVTVANLGNLAANLTKVTETDCNLDRMIIYFPDIETENEPALEEGDQCTFSVVVQWNPEDTTDTDGLETGTFAMTLTYENDELVFVADVADGTDDTNEAENVDNTVNHANAGSGSSASDSESHESTAAAAATTGDDSVLLLWYLLAIAAGAGVLMCLRCARNLDRKV